MRLVFAGTPQAAVPSLAALIASERHEVAAVLTRPDARAGRGRTLATSPVKDLALAHDIPVLQPVSPREEGFADRLRALDPDLCPVVAYGALIPQPVLDVPPLGWVNLHFSLLPAWRGAAPVQHALWHGDDLTGATTFRLEPGMDTGPVYGVLTEAIRPRDTAGDLLARLADAGAQLLVATLDGIEDGEVRAEPQPADGISLAPKITSDDARVDWRLPAGVVDRQIRACTPAPGAWTTFRGERLKIAPVAPTLPAEPRLAPGELDGPRVGTGSGDVLLGTVQPAGRSAMDAAAWARGARLVPGERLLDE